MSKIVVSREDYLAGVVHHLAEGMDDLLYFSDPSRNEPVVFTMEYVESLMRCVVDKINEGKLKETTQMLHRTIMLFMFQLIQLDHTLTSDKEGIEALDEKALQVIERCADISARKSADYSGEEDPFRNFRKCEKYGFHLLIGIVFRLSDKFSRYETLVEKPDYKAEVGDESIYDTMRDALNYMSIMCVYIDYNDR